MNSIPDDFASYISMQNRIERRDEAVKLLKNLHTTKDRISKQLVQLDAIAIPKVTLASPMHDILVASYGTKVAGMIQYVSNLLGADPTNRVLMFSCNNELLAVAKKLFDHFGFQAHELTGSVVRKTKALRAFRKDGSNARILLLNTSHSASGTNLVEATHVILLDPVLSDSGTTYAKEQQAIGRAYRQGQTRKVQVVKFYIRNTVEQEAVEKKEKTEVKGRKKKMI
jgi:SNF2 family DNA or RNA helicase